MKIATLSFDDGGAGDVEVVRLLKEAITGVPATFYLCSALLLPSVYDGRDRDDIRSLYDGYEVGNHTRTHKHLPGLGEVKLAAEVWAGLVELREFFPSHNIRCFSYPAGKHSPAAEKMVKDSGMEYARTCKRDNPAAVASPPRKMAMPITFSLRRARDVVTPGAFEIAVEADMPVHLSSHGWEVRVKDLGASLTHAILILKSSGYTFLTNYNFFKETLA